MSPYYVTAKEVVSTVVFSIGTFDYSDGAALIVSSAPSIRGSHSFVLGTLLMDKYRFLLSKIRGVLIKMRRLQNNETGRFLSQRPFFSLPLVSTVIETRLHLGDVIRYLSYTKFLRTDCRTTTTIRLNVRGSGKSSTTAMTRISEGLTVTTPLSIISVLYTIKGFTTASNVLLHSYPFHRHFSNNDNTDRHESCDAVNASKGSNRRNERPIGPFLYGIGNSTDDCTIRRNIHYRVARSSVTSDSAHDVPVSRARSTA